MLKMIATTNDNLQRRGGSSTEEWLSRNRWSPKSKIPKTRNRTCNTFDWTTANSKWRTIGWKCIQMVRHRPLWYRVSVVCRSIGREFDVEFDLFARGVPMAERWREGEWKINFKRQKKENRHEIYEQRNLLVFGILDRHQRMSMAQTHRTIRPAMRQVYWMELLPSCLCSKVPNSWRKIVQTPPFE